MNLAINAPSGEGKTHAIMKTIELFPNNDVICIAGMTPKALFHRPGKFVIKDDSGKYTSLEKRQEEIESEIKDLESEIASTNDSTIKQARQYQIKELQQEMKDLPKQTRKLIDLTGLTIVLGYSPVELFAAIMSLLSHDRNEAEYNFTDTNNGIKTKTNVLRGFPAIIFTAAVDYSHNKRFPEIQRRFIIVNPKMTKEKYNNAVKQIVSDTEKDKAREIILNLQQDIMELSNGPDKTSHNQIFNPYFESISGCVPNTEAADMSAADRFFDFIALSTTVNSSRRPKLKLIRKNDFLVQAIPLATFDDLKEAVSLMDNNNGIRPYILEWYNDVFLKVYNDKAELDSKNGKTEDRIAVTTKELVDKTLEIKNKSLSSQKLLENYIYPLMNSNYISSENSQIDHRAKIYYPVFASSNNKNNNLFEIKLTNKLSQNNKIAIKDFTIFPSKSYITSRIRDIMEYSSDYKLLILEDENGIQLSIEELVNRYYSNPDEYFTSDRSHQTQKISGDSRSNEYLDPSPNNEVSQNSYGPDVKNTTDNTELQKELLGSSETNNFIYSHENESRFEIHIENAGIQANAVESSEFSHASYDDNDINLENDKADQSLTNNNNQIRRAMSDNSSSKNNISSHTKDLSHLSQTPQQPTRQIIEEFFYDEGQPYRPPPPHTLDESPCKSIIRMDDHSFYYCTLHPEVRNIHLESIEHHIKYKYPEMHKSEILNISNFVH